MSKVSVKNSATSQTETKKSVTSLKDDEELDDVEELDDYEELDNSTKPEFIYGGPFVKSSKPIFVDIVTPINLQLQGIFKRSFAYHSLKERFPVILTKIIDYLSREGAKVQTANDASHKDVRSLIQYVVQLKNDIATNKRYALLTTDTPESHQWNEWINNSDSPYYFTNNWVFSECYVYRRLREGCELTKGLGNFDPFEEQKIQSFTNSLELMCMVAERVTDMLKESEKDKRKADFITLLKVCLWSNKCDLSLSMGEQVSLVNNQTLGTSPSQTFIDPLQMILDFKDKVLVDDSAKICDQVIAKAENLAKVIEANPSVKAKCSCSRLAPAGLPPVEKRKGEEVPPPPEEAPPPPEEAPPPPEEAPPPPEEAPPPPEEAPPPPEEAPLPPEEAPPPTEEAPPPPEEAPPPPEEAPPPPEEGEGPSPPPCPSKMTSPATVMFDIVCDNAGYELFTDLCLADFLISQNIVKKVRFHVKNIPWFVSDVTPKDFKYVIRACADISFNKVVQPPPQPEGAEEEGAEEEGAEKEGAEKEGADKEGAEKEGAEKEGAEKERAEKERAEKERAEKEGAEKERAEKERAEKEGAEKERAEKEGAEKERAEKEGAEKEGAEKEGAEKEGAEKERAEKEGAEEEEEEGEAPSPKTLNVDALRDLGERWGKYLDHGTFELMCDGFWTSPHVYKDMKKYDPQLYRNLQFAVAILFKGDLNYRKLLGERNCNPTVSFESALQGFTPAPLIALRTVKSDLICGLKKGRKEQLTNDDERWMEKGDYGVIQFCSKFEALKVSNRPCPMYGESCRGEGCGGAP